MLSDKAMKARAVRAFVGVALRNLTALSADDKHVTGIEEEINQAEVLLVKAQDKLLLAAKVRGEAA